MAVTLTIVYFFCFVPLYFLQLCDVLPAGELGIINELHKYSMTPCALKSKFLVVKAKQGTHLFALVFWCWFTENEKGACMEISFEEP